MKIDGNENANSDDKSSTEEVFRLRQELKELRTQMLHSEKLSTMGMLSAGIAHEIKNPLNFIRNFAELSAEYLEEIADLIVGLKEEEVVAEIKKLINDAKGNLDKIQHHEGRISSIVTSMLLHARGGSGKFELTDINQVIKEFVSLAFHGMRASKDPINVEIQQNLNESLPLVPLKREDFSRVILNLCNNAFDALRENRNTTTKNTADSNTSKKAVLKISTFKEVDSVVIVIEDNGPGIPTANLDKIFEPFFTTKKGSQGTGLGLGITKDIVDNHEGNIKIESKEGEYTKIIIKIPSHNNELKNENIDS